MTHRTTLSISGIDTDVTVEYKNQFGNLVITGMQDMDGNEICPDLLGECDARALLLEIENSL